MADFVNNYMQFNKLYDLIKENTLNAPDVLYKWMSEKNYNRIIQTNKIPVKRWAHFIESENRFIKGNSFSDEENHNKWKLPEYSHLLKIKTANLPNKIFPINGNRTYLLTQGLTNNNFDPNVYKDESTDIDEYFIEGIIMNISSIVVN